MAMPRFDLGGALIEGLQAGQADAMRRRQMDLEEARIRQQMQFDAAREAYDASLRPLRQTQERLSLGGQLIGPIENQEQLEAVRPVLENIQYPLLKSLPSEIRSEAWQTFAKRPGVEGMAPKEPTVAPSWMPEKWATPGEASLFGAKPLLPAAPVESPLPEGNMVNQADMGMVRNLAQTGLSLDKQERFKDADIGRQIQLANLDRVRQKDELSQRWMDFQKEAKVQGMSEAQAQREFQRKMALLGYNLDMSRFALQKDIETNKANATKTPNEGQSKAALFGGQVFEGKTEMDSLLAEGFDPTSIFDATGAMLAGTVLNPLASEKAQLWRQAIDRVTNAALRFESGAAIGEQEAARKIKETVPKYGDSPAVVRSKMRTIEQIIDGLEVAAGPAGGSVRNGSKTRAGGQTKPTGSADTPPVSVLKEGVGKKFPNGQVWTLRNGQAVRVK